MGTINQGILGGFRGKVGNVVGFFWKGQAVMRALAGSVANPRTPAQVNNRSRFSLAGSLVSLIYPVAANLFDNPYRVSSVSKSRTKVNMLMRSVLASVQNATTPATSAVDCNVDFSSLKLSDPFGDVVNPTGVTASAASGGGTNIMLTWNDNSSADASIASNDVVMIAAFPSSRDAGTGLFTAHGVVFNDGEFTRRDQTGTLACPATWAGETCEVYMITRRADATLGRSESIYVGSVQLP